MNKTVTYIKRALTAVLITAMAFTSLPMDTFAAYPGQDDVILTDDAAASEAYDDLSTAGADGNLVDDGDTAYGTYADDDNITAVPDGIFADEINNGGEILAYEGEAADDIITDDVNTADDAYITDDADTDDLSEDTEFSEDEDAGSVAADNDGPSQLSIVFSDSSATTVRIVKYEIINENGVIGQSQYAYLSNGTGTVNAPAGSKIRILYIFYLENAFHAVKGVKYRIGEGKEKDAVKDENGLYTTDTLNKDTKINFELAKLKADSITIDPDQTNLINYVPNENNFISKDGVNYVAIRDFVIDTIEIRDTELTGKVISGVTYKIKGDDTVYRAYKSIDPPHTGKYVIGRGLMDGIIAGGITIHVVIDDPTRKITFMKPANGDTIKWAEYSQTGDDVYDQVSEYEKTLTFPAGESQAYVEISSENTLGFSVTPKAAVSGVSNAYYLTENSVYLDDEEGTILKAYQDDDYKGKYFISAIDVYDSNPPVIVRSRPAVPVILKNARGVIIKKGEQDLTRFGDTWYGLDLDKTGNHTYVSKNEAIAFSVSLTTDAIDRAVLEKPLAYYGEGEAKHVFELEEGKVGETLYYAIQLEDVQAAMEAGEPITIEGRATPIPFSSVTVHADHTKIKKVSFGGDIRETVDVTDDDEATAVCFSGSSLSISGVKYTSDYERFSGVAAVKVEQGIRTLGINYVSDNEWYYNLGRINGDVEVTLTTAVLPASSIVFEGDVQSGEDQTAYYTPGIKDPVKVNGTDYIPAKCYAGDSNSSEKLGITLTVNSTDPVNRYRIKQPVTYEVEDGGQWKANLQYDGTYSLKPTPLAEAAFSGKTVTVTANIEQSGHNPVAIRFNTDSDKETDRVLINGEPYKANEIPYGQDATVVITQKAGYRLKDVFYKPTASEDDKDTVHAAVKDGRATFTIRNIKEGYEVYSVTEEGYSLLLNGKEITSPYSETVPYTFYGEFTVLHGSTKMDISEDVCTVTATSSGSDITDNVLTYYESDKEYTFDSYCAAGQTVTIEIKAKPDEDGNTAFDFTATLKVTDMLTAEDVKISAESPVNLTLGVAATIPVTHKNNVSADAYEAKLVRGNLDWPRDLKARITKSKDGKSFSIMVPASVVSQEPDLLTADNLNLVLIDKEESIIGAAVPVTVSAPPIETASLEGCVSVVPHENSLEFKFLGLPDGITAGTDGLYWIVSAIKNDGYAGEYKNIEGKPVPVSRKSCEFTLVDYPETFSAEPVPYGIQVELAQLADPGNPSDDIVKSSYVNSYKEENVNTLTDGTYANKIRFVKNKKLPKKIYTTMDELLLGTVKYDPLGTKGKLKKTYPSVQKLLHIVVQASDGSHVDNSIVAAAFRIDGNDIYFTPEKFVRIKEGIKYSMPGKYTVVMRAVQPESWAVTATYSLKIDRGMEQIMVTTSGMDMMYGGAGIIYKPLGKKSTTVQAKAYDMSAMTGYQDMIKAKPSKKVKWSLVSADYGGNPETDEYGKLIPFKHAGISINAKNGKITVKPNTVIPEGGLSFCVVAAANDWKGSPVYGYQYMIVSAVANKPKFVTISNIGNGYTELRNNESYYSAEVSGAVSNVTDENGSTLSTVSAVRGLKTIKMCGNDFMAFATKPVIRNASVTVTAADGSGQKTSVKFNVKSDVNLKAAVGYGGFDSGSVMGLPGWMYEIGGIFAECGAGETVTVDNDYSTGVPLYLMVSGEHDSLINHKINVSGGKKSVKSLYNGSLYIIRPNSKTTTITLTEKATGKKAIIRINNTAYSKTAINAVKASNTYAIYNSKKNSFGMKDNKGTILAGLHYGESYGSNGSNMYKMAGSINKVTYTVTRGKKKKAKALAGETVRISTQDAELYNVFKTRFKQVGISGFNEFEVTLDEKGSFVVDYVDSTGSFSIKPGKHTFTVTPLGKDGKAAGKPQTVTVKAIKTPKAKVQLKQTTFNNFGAEQYLTFKTMDNIVICKLTEGDDVWYRPYLDFNNSGYGDNVAGSITNFRDAFDANSYMDGYVLKHRLRVKSTPAPDADSTTGWVGYWYLNLDGTNGLDYSKVTLKKIAPVT